MSNVAITFVSWLQGSSRGGIPGGHALYARRLSCLRDHFGNQLILRADCGFCAHKAHFPFAITKIDRHLRTRHGQDAGP